MEKRRKNFAACGSPLTLLNLCASEPSYPHILRVGVMRSLAEHHEEHGFGATHCRSAPPFVESAAIACPRRDRARDRTGVATETVTPDPARLVRRRGVLEDGIFRVEAPSPDARDGRSITEGAAVLTRVRRHSSRPSPLSVSRSPASNGRLASLENQRHFEGFAPSERPR